MQGGCTCENGCGLRVDQGNVEFAAMFAPKPLALSAANDWTKEMSTKGFPELKQLYTMLGSADRVQLLSRTEFGHNYNAVSRQAMYDWFAKHLRLPKFVEQELETLPAKELTVFDDRHPKPPSSDEWEARFLRVWHERERERLDWRNASFASEIERLQRIQKIALQRLVHLKMSKTKTTPSAANQGQAKSGQTWVLSSSAHPMKTRFRIANSNEGKKVDKTVITLSRNGIQSDFRSVDPNSQARRISIEWAGLETVDSDSPRGFFQLKNRLVKNGREAGGYTYGYNRPLFAWRVQQLVDLIQHSNREGKRRAIHIEADTESLPIALYATAIVKPGTVKSLKGDTGKFRFDSIDDLRHPHFVAGVVKFGDVDGLAALATLNGTDLRLINESKTRLPQATYVARLLGRQPEDSEGTWTNRGN